MRISQCIPYASYVPHGILKMSSVSGDVLKGQLALTYSGDASSEYFKG